jgi:hypothetical protein
VASRDAFAELPARKAQVLAFRALLFPPDDTASNSIRRAWVAGIRSSASIKPMAFNDPLDGGDAPRVSPSSKSSNTESGTASRRP